MHNVTPHILDRIIIHDDSTPPMPLNTDRQLLNVLQAAATPAPAAPSAPAAAPAAGKQRLAGRLLPLGTRALATSGHSCTRTSQHFLVPASVLSKLVQGNTVHSIIVSKSDGPTHCTRACKPDPQADCCMGGKNGMDSSHCATTCVQPCSVMAHIATHHVCQAHETSHDAGLSQETPVTQLGAALPKNCTSYRVCPAGFSPLGALIMLGSPC